MSFLNTVSDLSRLTPYYSNLTNNRVGPFNHVGYEQISQKLLNVYLGLNKAVQDGFFPIYVGEYQVLKEKSKKLINVQAGPNKVVQVFFPKK